VAGTGSLTKLISFSSILLRGRPEQQPRNKLA
jgi:hypothetical protein